MCSGFAADAEEVYERFKVAFVCSDDESVNLVLSKSGREFALFAVCLIGERFPDAAASRVDDDGFSGFRIRQLDESDVRQRLFTWIDQVHNNGVVFLRQGSERFLEIGIHEVARNHDD